MADYFFGEPFRRLLFTQWPGSSSAPMDWLETQTSHIIRINVPGTTILSFPLSGSGSWSDSNLTSPILYYRVGEGRDKDPIGGGERSAHKGRGQGGREGEREGCRVAPDGEGERSVWEEAGPARQREGRSDQGPCRERSAYCCGSQRARYGEAQAQKHSGVKQALRAYVESVKQRTKYVCVWLCEWKCIWYCWWSFVGYCSGVLINWLNLNKIQMLLRFYTWFMY